MMRLVGLAFVVLAGIALFGLAVAALARGLREAGRLGVGLGRGLAAWLEDLDIRTIAFIALLVVMTGVAVGRLGGF